MDFITTLQGLLGTKQGMQTDDMTDQSHPQQISQSQGGADMGGMAGMLGSIFGGGGGGMALSDEKHKEIQSILSDKMKAKGRY